MISDGSKGKGDEHFPGLDAGLRAGFKVGPTASGESGPRSEVPQPAKHATVSPSDGVLSKGQMLSCYEVVGPLGKGGMGEVYRARDTRLEREVALKVLPAAVVEDEEHLSRFQREAKLLASLNHPNVATIHGLDHVDGIYFLVLELVPGETLRSRLGRGPLPVAEAVRVTQQIAAGLEAAHEKGIVHRDLKPANVILRPDGLVKVLDFGLAKRTEVTDQSEGGLTKAFQVLGTPGYLSPEQARGEEADQRADMWALGCILYECLAGSRAFPGTMSESIRAIFEQALDLEALPAETPPTARLLLSHCLAKDSSSRLRAMSDVKLLLDGALDDPSQITAAAVVKTKGRDTKNRVLIACLAIAIVAAGTLAFFLVNALTGGSRPRTGTKTLGLPYPSELGWRETSANLSKLGRGSPLLAISPDGRCVAYCAKTSQGSAIYMHVVGQAEARVLQGTENARAPFFAPDNERIGFLENDKIQTVSTEGGTPETIRQIVSPAPNFSACFTADGKAIIYATRKGLRMVSQNGGNDNPLTSPNADRGEVEHLGPSALPDGEHVVFTVATGTKTAIALLKLSTRKWTRIVPLGGTARYARGQLVFARKGSIRRAPFDPARRKGIGLSQPVQDRVFATPCAGGGSAVTHFDVAEDGTLAYAPALAKPTRSTAYWVDRDSEGVGRAIDSDFGDWKHPRILPGGGGFSVDILKDWGAKDVHLYRSGQGFVGKLTRDGMSINSAWSPSPDPHATVRSTHLGQLRLGDQQLTRVTEGVLYADSWTRDGKTLIVTKRKSGSWSLWKWERGKGLEPLFSDKIDDGERFGQISPEGNWLAYVSDVNGKPEVFVRPYPALVPRLKVSRGGGGAPMWAKKGIELFYRRPDGTMFAVTFETEPRIRLKQPPQKLFTNNYDADPAGHQHYDVSEDGRFLMIKNELCAPHHVHIVWDALRESASAR